MIATTSREELEAKVAEYYALLHAVERKFEDESRYETAMRYIREAEARCMNGKASTATSHKPADIPDTAPQPPATLVSYRQKTWMT